MAERRFFWLKLKEDFFRQKEIKKLRQIAGGDTYTIIYGELYLMGKLWEKNQGLVRYVAGRYRENGGRLFDFADLMQAGYLGLHTAAVIYTAECGAAFATYAAFHIRRAMRDVAGLRGKRDALFDACTLYAPKTLFGGANGRAKVRQK